MYKMRRLTKSFDAIRNTKVPTLQQNRLSTLRDNLRAKMLAERRALASALGCSSDMEAVSIAASEASTKLLGHIWPTASSSAQTMHSLVVRDTETDRGEGVYLASPSVVQKGTPMCFYGGLIFTKDEVAWLGGSPMCFQQCDPHYSEDSQANLSYLLGCSGGSVINGAPNVLDLGIDVRLEGPEENIAMSHRGENKAARIGWDPRHTFKCIDDLKEREASTSSSTIVNLESWDKRRQDNSFYSMGSKINHPPPGHAVNVVGWPVSLQAFYNDDAFIDNEMFAPCVHGIRGSWLGQDKIVCSSLTVVFIAINDIYEGDEIFLDYKIVDSPRAPLPKWYSEAAMLSIKD